MNKAIIHFLWGAFLIILIRVVFASGNSSKKVTQVEDKTRLLPTLMESKKQEKKFYILDLVELYESADKTSASFSPNMLSKNKRDNTIPNDAYIHNTVIENVYKENASAPTYNIGLNKYGEFGIFRAPNIIMFY